MPPHVTCRKKNGSYTLQLNTGLTWHKRATWSSTAVAEVKDNLRIDAIELKELL